jgi:hypothetical protein
MPVGELVSGLTPATLRRDDETPDDSYKRVVALVREAAIHAASAAESVTDGLGAQLTERPLGLPA